MFLCWSRNRSSSLTKPHLRPSSRYSSIQQLAFPNLLQLEVGLLSRGVAASSCNSSEGLGPLHSCHVAWL